MNENPINVHCVWIINFDGFEKIGVWGRGGVRDESVGLLEREMTGGLLERETSNRPMGLLSFF